MAHLRLYQLYLCHPSRVRESMLAMNSDKMSVQRFLNNPNLFFFLKEEKSLGYDYVPQPPSSAPMLNIFLSLRNNRCFSIRPVCQKHGLNCGCNFLLIQFQESPNVHYSPNHHQVNENAFHTSSIKKEWTVRLFSILSISSSFVMVDRSKFSFNFSISFGHSFPLTNSRNVFFSSKDIKAHLCISAINVCGTDQISIILQKYAHQYTVLITAISKLSSTSFINFVAFLRKQT